MKLGHFRTPIEGARCADLTTPIPAPIVKSIPKVNCKHPGRRFGPILVLVVR